MTEYKYSHAATCTGRNSCCTNKVMSPVALQHWGMRNAHTTPLFPVFQLHNTPTPTPTHIHTHIHPPTCARTHTHACTHTQLLPLLALTRIGTLSCVLSSRMTQQSRVCSGMAAFPRLRTKQERSQPVDLNLHWTH